MQFAGVRKPLQDIARAECELHRRDVDTEPAGIKVVARMVNAWRIAGVGQDYHGRPDALHDLGRGSGRHRHRRADVSPPMMWRLLGCSANRNVTLENLQSLDMGHSRFSSCCRRSRPHGSDPGGAASGSGTGDFLVRRRGLSVRRDAHGHHARCAGLQEWFIKSMTLLNNTFGVRRSGELGQSSPVASSICGPPRRSNKRRADGSENVVLCLFPYPCDERGARRHLKTWPFRLVSHPLFMVLSPVFSAASCGCSCAIGRSPSACG